MKNNYAKHIICNIFYACTNLLITGTVMQTFLLESGVGEHTVANFEAAMLVLQSAAMLLMSGRIEKNKSIIGCNAVTSGLKNLVLLPVLLFCVAQVGEPERIFVMVCLFGAIGSIFYGVHSIVSYKIPYHIIDMSDYGRLTGVSGIVGGICATVFSGVITFFNSRFGFFGSMKYIVAFGIALSVLSVIVAFKMKRVNNCEAYQSENSTGSLISCIRYKPFYALLFPNLCRGICTGVINVAAVIGYYYKVLDGESAAAVVILMQLASVLGAALYVKLCRSNMEGGLILYSAVIMLVFMPFMTSSDTAVFLGAFFISKLAITVIDHAVPVAVVKIVDYTYIGRYSALRMITHTVGTALGSGIVMSMIETCGGVATMVAAGICMTICGVAYYTYLRRYKRRNFQVSKKVTANISD